MSWGELVHMITSRINGFSDIHNEKVAGLLPGILMSTVCVKVSLSKSPLTHHAHHDHLSLGHQLGEAETEFLL